MADTLIIGAGVAGMMSAVELVARGDRVRLLDVGGSRTPASWAGGGILSPLFPWRYPDALQALVGHAVRDYQHWQQRILAAGGPDPEIRQDGMRVYARDPQRAQQWAQRHGQALSVIDDDDAVWAASADTTPLWLPQVASIRNPRLLQGLQVLLQQAGVPVLSQQASAIELTGQGVRVRVEGDVYHHAERVLVAAGAWSSSLLAPWSPPPIFPVRGQMLLYRSDESLPCIVLDEAGYLIPRRDGLVLAGSTIEPHITDTLPTAAAYQQLRHMAEHLWPALRQAELLGQWAGIRPGTDRLLPLIGSVPGTDERVWLNGGHFRNGLVCAPASARLISKLMSGQNDDCDAEPYALSLSSASSLSSPS